MAQVQDEQLTGAQIVVRALLEQGVRHIFGYPGGAVLPIYDALFNQDQIEHILVRHEQGAAHAREVAEPDRDLRLTHGAHCILGPP